MYDVIIIGSGPSGITAAIYAKRAMLNMAVIEKNYMGGGQVLNTYEVDNYPALKGINGFDLGMKFLEHAKALGVDFMEEEVIEIISEEDKKTVITNKQRYETKSVIISTGASHKKLNIKGEAEYTGKGVSYCATCDGAFFRDKTVAVVGGGDVAAEDAIFLSRMCKKVYLIHRRDELRAAKSLQEKLFATENIEIIWDSTVESIYGKENVEGITIKNKNTNETKDISLQGIFVAVGMAPNSRQFKKLVKTDADGWIIAGEDCKTSHKGIYAAGDVRTKSLRQIITAASDGANAVYEVQKFLLNEKQHDM